MSSNRHRNMTGEQLHNPKGFDSASNNTTMVKDGSGSVLWTAQTDLPQALNIVSPQSAPPTENSGDVYIMDTTGTAYDINTITWQSGNTIRIAFNGSPDLSAVAADDYFVTSGNANSSNDGTFQISAVNDGSDYIDIINLNRSDATDDEATDAVGTGYYTLEEWDGVSKNMHVRFDGTSWISVTPSAGYTCYDITSGNILIYNGTDWSTTITTSGSASTLSEVLTAGNATGANNIDLATGQRVAYAADDNDDWVGISATGSTATLMAQGSGIPASATQIDLTKSTATITSTAGTFAGLQEASDYSANYSALSLVNKTYADALVSGLGTLSNVVEDTTPQLGGSLDVNGQKIVSVSNGDIDIEPNGTGNVLLGNFTFDADQTVGAGQDNYVLTYDNASGLISLEASGGGSAWTDTGTSINYSGHGDYVEFKEQYFQIAPSNVANTLGIYHEQSIYAGTGITAGGASGTLIRTLALGATMTLGNTANTANSIFAGSSITFDGGSNNLVVGSSLDVDSASNSWIGGNSINNTTSLSKSLVFSTGDMNLTDTVNGAVIMGYSQYGIQGDNIFGMGYQLYAPSTSNNKVMMLGFDIQLTNPASKSILIGAGQDDGQYLQISSAYEKGVYFGSGSNKPFFGVAQAQSGVGTGTSGKVGNLFFGVNICDDGGTTGVGEGAFHLENATVKPTTALANTTAIYSTDLSAGNTMLGMRTEGTPIGSGTPTQDTTIALEVNGTTYYVLASTSAT